MRLVVPGLTPGQEYAVQVRADFDGEKSGWSARYDFIAAENANLPDTPTNVTWVVTGDAFYGEWDTVTINDNADWPYLITRYEIELVGNGITQIIQKPQTDEPRPNYLLDFANNVAMFGGPSATVTFRVRSVDVMGLKSPWSSVITATNPPPPPVTDLTAQAIIDGVHLTWTAPDADDLIGYHIYAKPGVDQAGFDPGPLNFAGFSGSTNFTFVTANYSIWHFVVVAVDKFNSESSITRASATPTSPFLVDVDAPPTPVLDTYVITTNDDVPSAELTVEWLYPDPPTDLADFVLHYRRTSTTIWETLVIPSTDDDMTLSATIPNIKPYSNYDIQVAARDHTGNQSDWTAIIEVSGGVNAAPSKPATPSAATGTQQIQVVHSGNRATGPAMETDVVEYEVYASTTNGFTTYDSTTLLGKIAAGPAIVGTFHIPAEDGETWYVKVIAVDAGGLKSIASNQATATVGLISSVNIGTAAITSANIADLSVTKLVAGSGLINDFTIKSELTLGDGTTDGAIQSWEWEDSGGTAGFRLADSGLVIKDGEIEAAALKIQNSPNIMPAPYADFEYGDWYYTNPFWNVRGQAKLYVEGSITYDDQAAGNQKFGLKGLNVHSFSNNIAETLWFGEHATNYNIDVSPGERLIYSIYISNRISAVENGWSLRIKGSDGIIFLDNPINLPADAGWYRYQVPFTVPAGVTKILVGLRKSTATTPVGFILDGVQVERVEAGLEVASPWKPPASTTISGAGITTGIIRSSQNISVNGINQPLWSINMAGNAQFGDASVRGKMIVGPPTGTDAGNSFIASGNYVYGSAGWKVKDDGTAEFADITSRAPNGTRTVIANGANPYEGGQQWNIISMYSNEPTWSPGQIWVNYIPGSPSEAYMHIASPKLGAADPARIKLWSRTDNVTLAQINAKYFSATADTYTFGDPNGQFIDFNMGYQAANSTQRWRFNSPGGKSIIFRYGTLGTNDILCEGESSQRIRLDVYASDFYWYSNQAFGNLYFGAATHGNFGNSRFWVGTPDVNTGLTFWNGEMRVTTASAANLQPIRASAFNVGSDITRKSDIKDTKPVLENLRKLGVYDYKTPDGQPRKLGGKVSEKAKHAQRGLMAQEIQKVWPDAVVSNEDGSTMGVDLYYLLSTSIKATQELAAKVEELEAKLASLPEK